MRRACPDCQPGQRCQSCREYLGAKQARRRARRLAEGAERRVVWGHAQKPSGTGWDSYNAVHEATR